MSTRLPPLAPRVGAVSDSVFATLLAKHPLPPGPIFPLHVGDTWKAPPPGSGPQDVSLAEHPSANRYTPVPGLPALREAVAARVGSRSGHAVSHDEVVVTSGATAGLSAVVSAIVAPGQQVLVPVPAWPLFAGGVRAQGADPVLVPWLDVEDPQQAVARLAAHATDRTVAVYVNTPNNPTGRVWRPEVVDAVVAFAASRGWWVIADEVYEDHVFEGTHTPVRSRDPERTISAYSASKGFGMAGYRVGWVVAPAPVAKAVARMQTYATYCAPHVGQLAALNALGPSGTAWVEEARAEYAALGREAAARLGVAAPQGSTFLFVDAARALDERGIEPLLVALLRQGVLVSPGESFGPYPTHLRLCFTSAAPDVVREGIDRVARLLQTGPPSEPSV